MNLYLALTSNTTIVLLDEILSEISVVDGLRLRVINTILNWSNKSSKLIIIVGHGVFDNIDIVSDCVVKLKIITSELGNTELINFN